MIKRSFIGLAKPKLLYETLESALPKPESISTPKKVTLLLNSVCDQSNRKDDLMLKEGDSVITGQKLSLAGESDEYVISTVTGTVSSLKPYVGNFGRVYTAVSIKTAQEEEIDDQFGKTAKDPTIDSAANFLLHLPGAPPLHLLLNSEKPISTIVICGLDYDLLVSTNQYVFKTDNKAINNGIGILKKITGIDDVIIAVPRHLAHEASLLDAEIRVVDINYPSALPKIFMKDGLKKEVPAGKDCEDLGVCFFSSEAVAAIGNAFDSGQIPVTKLFTVVKKDGSKRLVSARIGTPIGDVFKKLMISIEEKDRIIIGGPMTGASVYSEDFPVTPDTDAVIIQDGGDIYNVSDYPCINCGECIRICPAKVPVNMLVRLLESGLYEEAADQYDLLSCIECGLCSYVCTSRMPIFQYIRLAKYELAQIETDMETDEDNTAEENNAK